MRIAVRGSARADSGPARGDRAVGRLVPSVSSEEGERVYSQRSGQVPGLPHGPPVGFPTAKGSGERTAPNPPGAAMGVSETPPALRE